MTRNILIYDVMPNYDYVMNNLPNWVHIVTDVHGAMV
jgi:hypothetical protein